MPPQLNLEALRPFEQWIQQNALPICALGVLLGFVQCFFGVRLWRAILALTGFVGGFVGGFIGAAIAGGGSEPPALWGALAGLALALLLAGFKGLGTFIYAWGTYASLSGLVAQIFLHQQRPPPEETLVALLALCAITGFVAAVVTVATRKRGIITVSSIGGAGAMLGAISALPGVHLPRDFDNPLTQLLVTAVLSTIGIVVQLLTSRDISDKVDSPQSTPSPPVATPGDSEPVQHATQTPQVGRTLLPRLAKAAALVLLGAILAYALPLGMKMIPKGRMLPSRSQQPHQAEASAEKQSEQASTPPNPSLSSAPASSEPASPTVVHPKTEIQRGPAEDFLDAVSSGDAYRAAQLWYTNDLTGKQACRESWNSLWTSSAIGKAFAKAVEIQVQEQQAGDSAETAISLQFALLKERFSETGDGTVTDKLTGLTWQKLSKDDLRPKTYADALNGCGSASAGGRRDWRLPTIPELATILIRSGYRWQEDLLALDTYHGDGSVWSQDGYRYFWDHGQQYVYWKFVIIGLAMDGPIIDSRKAYTGTSPDSDTAYVQLVSGAKQSERNPDHEWPCKSSNAMISRDPRAHKLSSFEKWDANDFK